MNSRTQTDPELLKTLAQAFQKIQDPRDPRGVRHDFQGMVVIVFLGLLARLSYVQHWAEKHWHALRAPLGFKRTKPPVETIFSRNLANVSIKDFQETFAEFLNLVLYEKSDFLIAAVDGKTAKQMYDKEENPLSILPVFLHDVKVTLEQWSVHGEDLPSGHSAHAHFVRFAL